MDGTLLVELVEFQLFVVVGLVARAVLTDRISCCDFGSKAGVGLG